MPANAMTPAASGLQAHLYIVSEIAQHAARNGEIEDILARTVDLLVTHLPCQFAGVYLLDERRTYAVLQAAAGEAAETLLASGCRLKVGGEGLVGFVTAAGKPRMTQDDLPRLYPSLAQTSLAIALPMISSQQMIGALEICSRAQTAFSEEELTTLQTAANQLAAAVDAAHMVDSARNQLDELIVLHRLADITNTTATEDYLFEQTTALITENLSLLSFGVLLVNEQKDSLVPHPSYYGRQVLNLVSQTIAFGDGIAGIVAQQKRSWLVPNIPAQPACRSLDPAAQSALCLPVVIGTELAGVINAESREMDGFNRADQRLLETLAKQVATAVGKIRSHETLRQRAAELDTLRQAGLQLNAALDLPKVLQAILQAAQTIAHDKIFLGNLAQEKISASSMCTAQIFLFDGEKLDFGMALLPDGVYKTMENTVPDPPTSRVIGTRQPVLIADTGGHYLFAGLPQIGAVIGLPLLHSGDLWGVLNLYYPLPLAGFSEAKLRVLLLFADQAAAALVNARLYAEAGERAEIFFRALYQREELVRTRKEFMQNVSHELRTPLAIARGYAELLENAELGELNPEQQKAVSILNRRVQMLTLMVDDLVTILEAETIETQCEDCNLNEIVQRSLTDFLPTARQQDVELVGEMTPQALVIYGVPNHISRMVDNLISNAIKFSPPGSQIMLRLNAAHGDQPEAVLEVVDQGVGIPEDKLKRIFERFYQVDGVTKRRLGGSGLGLALVKEIAEAHGGQVGVVSELSKGSRFTVRLPLQTG